MTTPIPHAQPTSTTTSTTTKTQLEAHVQQLIDDLDTARAEGRIWTYGLIQERLRQGLERHTSAPTVKPGRDAVRMAVGSVLSNASNYPRAAQPRILGQDMGPLMDRTADAVLAIPPGKTEQDVRAEALRDAVDALRAQLNGGPATASSQYVAVGQEFLGALDRLADEEAARSHSAP